MDRSGTESPGSAWMAWWLLVSRGLFRLGQAGKGRTK